MRAKKQLRGLTPYKPGKNIEEVKKELGLKKVIKLASNENPFGTSVKVRQAIEKEVGQLAVYPDGYAGLLRQRLAESLGISHHRIIFGNGSDEVLQLICRAFLSPGLNTVMARPTFPQYKHNSVVEGAEVIEVPLREDGRHDIERMIAATDENTAVLWLCAVNNPTGEYIREHELREVLEKVPEDTLVVVDEAYYEYVRANDYPKTIELLDQYPNLFVTRTFSKAYGLAALRVGYGIGNEETIKELERVREPFNTSRLAQAAAIAALSDQDFIESSVRATREGLEKYYDFCQTHELRYYPSQGNFILIDFATSGDQIFEHLLKHGLIVRSGTALGTPTAVRITIGTKEQNEAVLNALEEWVKQEALS